MFQAIHLETWFFAAYVLEKEAFIKTCDVYETFSNGEAVAIAYGAGL